MKTPDTIRYAGRAWDRDRGVTVQLPDATYTVVDGTDDNLGTGLVIDGGPAIGFVAVDAADIDAYIDAIDASVRTHDTATMDAGELREWVAGQLADADEATFGENADAIAHGLDRLASVTGAEMSEVLRDIADDVDAMRGAGDAPADADESIPGTFVEVAVHTKHGTYTTKGSCIDTPEIVHATVIDMAARLAYRTVIGLDDHTDTPSRTVIETVVPVMPT